MAALGLTLAVAPAREAPATEPRLPPSVLLISPLRSTDPSVPLMESAFRSALETDYGAAVDFHVEALDLPDAGFVPFAQRLSDLLREKYSGRRMDAIVVDRPEALRFLLGCRPALFPGVPVVFLNLTRKAVETLRPPDATGVILVVEQQRTVSVALDLHPGTKRVVFMAGSSPADRAFEALGRSLVEARAPGLETISLAGLPLDEQLRRLGRLPANSVVFFVTYRADSLGRSMVSSDVVRLVARASSAPVYGGDSTLMGLGIVGGDLFRSEALAERAAGLTARVLRGEPPSSIPPVAEPSNQLTFDWRELRRWGIDEARLPPGSVVLFREKTLWSEYRRAILGGVALLLAQSALIGALLVARRNRIRALAQLAAAEQRYRTVADFTHDWEYWRRPDGSLAYVSPSCRRTTGYEAAEFERRPSLLDELVVEEDRARWEEHGEEAQGGGGASQLEFRIRTAGGQVRWVDHVCSRVTGEDGTFLGVRGSNRDVTDKKVSEEQLRTALAEVQRLRERLEADNTYLREQAEPGPGFEGIIGGSDVLRYVLSRVQQVAPTSSTVLLQGETGVGKELVAHALHNLSPRRARPLVKLNCAALPPSLVESELFGHEKGSFTGAVGQRKGRFEIADGSTLFLDEIGELPLELQVEAPAGDPGRGARARGRDHDAQDRRAPRGRHQPPPRGGGEGRALPRGPLVPAERLPDHDAAAAPTAGGHPAARAALRGEALPQAGPGGSPDLPGHDAGPAGARVAGQRPRARGGGGAGGHHQHRTGAADRRGAGGGRPVRPGGVRGLCPPRARRRPPTRAAPRR